MNTSAKTGNSQRDPKAGPSVITGGPIIGLGYRAPWRLGNASQARFAARRGFHVMLAQQSAREIERTGRTFRDVIDSAVESASEAGLRLPWGADGDHLRNEAEVRAAATAGCTHFTYDVTAELGKGFDALVDKITAMYSLTREIRGQEAFTTEISLDEGEKCTDPEEVARLLEALRSRKVQIDEIAPRFPGYFEKAIDYYRSTEKGRKICDTADFEAYLVRMAATGRLHRFRICIHSGSDKFSIYPIVARILKGNFHLKTAGTYYLEELKIVALFDLPLFMEIFRFSFDQFQKDRATYELSCDPDAIPDMGRLSGRQIADLLRSGTGNANLRQVMHVTYGSVLTARGPDCRPRFAVRMEETLKAHRREHEEAMQAHLERHFGLFAS